MMINSTWLKQINYYEIEIDTIKKELKTLPAGYLVKRGAHYYVKAGSVQKGITKDQQIVMQLARKAYLLRRLEHLEWNYSLAEKHAERYKTEDPREIIQGLSSFYRILPDNYFFYPSTHDQFRKTIAESAGHLNGLIYMTNSGISVRSKSERTIANALDQNGISYHYEAVLALGGVNRYPDFTITRPCDGKLFLWEHFGLMDQDGYKQKVIEKLALYVKYGFSPFENLICTYEQDVHNPAQIHNLIKAFLLR